MKIKFLGFIVLEIEFQKKEEAPNYIYEHCVFPQVVPGANKPELRVTPELKKRIAYEAEVSESQLDLIIQTINENIV